MTELLEFSDLTAREFPALCKFTALSRVPAEFGYPDSGGKILLEYRIQLWISCCMIRMPSLSALTGIHPRLSRDLAARGIHAIIDYFRDPEYSGWFSQTETKLDDTGYACPSLERVSCREAYTHTFVIIAASSAAVVGIPGACALPMEARQIQDCYWQEEAVGWVRDTYARDQSDCETYRSASTSMHTSEPALAVFDATGDSEYLRHAVSITGKIINQSTRGNPQRIPGHYATSWWVDFGYSQDNPTDPFRSWGMIPGCSFERTHLTLQLQATAQTVDLDLSLGWVPEATGAVCLTTLRAWGVDGTPGIPYITDFKGKPVSTQRIYRTVCEALGVSSTASCSAAQFPGGDILVRTTAQ